MCKSKFGRTAPLRTMLYLLYIGALKLRAWIFQYTLQLSRISQQHPSLSACRDERIINCAGERVALPADMLPITATGRIHIHTSPHRFASSALILPDGYDVNCAHNFSSDWSKSQMRVHEIAYPMYDCGCRETFNVIGLKIIIILSDSIL
jgi:hypothetical protein